MAFNLVSAEQIKAVNLDDPDLPEDGGSGMTIKVDTAANLTKENPILLKGQLGAESDTTYMKLGDGATAWNDLEYIKANKSVQDAVGNVITDTYLKKTGDTATGDITAPNFVGHLKGNADYATNADRVDGFHESSFLRCRGRTNTGGEDTLWSQIGIKEYDAALPKGISGTYNYGSVVSLPGIGTRLDIWYNHRCSANKDGLWYRSGYSEDQQPWAQLLDSNNYTNWTPTKTGTGASGTWNINISGNAVKDGNGNNIANTYATKTGKGASGTWGINISGNAATATKLQTARTISLTGNASGSTTFDGSENVNINTTVNTMNNQGIKTAIKDGTEEPYGLNLYKVYNNGYPATYGNLISIGGTGGGELLAGWSNVDHGVEHLYYRNRRNDGALWSNWSTIAFTTDINNYAPTKTGGGASGTWGINISGNAASATTAKRAERDEDGVSIAGAYVKRHEDIGDGGTNLNSLMLSGLYTISNSGAAIAKLNYPEPGHGGCLIVVGDAYVCTQIYTAYGTHNSYIREWHTTWSAWRKYAFEDSTVAKAVSDGDGNNIAATYATKAELSGIQGKLTFDSTPTANSSNPVTSDGVKKYVDSAIASLISADDKSY